MFEHHHHRNHLPRQVGPVREPIRLFRSPGSGAAREDPRLDHRVPSNRRCARERRGGRSNTCISTALRHPLRRPVGELVTARARSMPVARSRPPSTAATGRSYAGDDVTIDVAAGTYTENDTVDASSLDSLTIQGVGHSVDPRRRQPGRTRS